MSDRTQPSTQRPSVFEELVRTDLAWWKSVIGRLGDPVTARIVVQYLDGHPELRTKRSGVYLVAAEACSATGFAMPRPFVVGAQSAFSYAGFLVPLRP